MMDRENRYRATYGSISTRLPAPLRTLISKAVYHMRRRPVYRLISPQNRMLKTGTAVFSADLELAWAWRFARDMNRNISDLCRAERENVPLILEKLETLNIPVTWAIVGHLFLDRCDRHEKKAHCNMPRPGYFTNKLWSYISGDWYDGDPGSDAKSNPNWYAPDLIRNIIKMRIKHEIACHSFSHVGFDKNNCTTDLARAELRQCSEVMAAWNLKPVTMIFPGDQAGHFALLCEFGYRCVRYFPDRDVEISLPVRMESGLWAFPVASNIVPDEDWDSRYILWRLKRCVDKAIRKKALCHFWFHPSISRQRIEEVLFPVLEYCAQKRTTGELTVMTMKGMVEFME